MRDEYDFSAGKRGPVLRRPTKDGDGVVDLPVVCTLTPTTIATRKAALLPGLVARADSTYETATGMRLRLPADALSAVLETVDAEPAPPDSAAEDGKYAGLCRSRHRLCHR